MLQNTTYNIQHKMFNEDWYLDSQLDDLINLYEKTKNIHGKVIEIGCWEGKSTIQIANACFPETLICNDTWLGNVKESEITGITHVTETILKERDVYGIFVDNMNKYTQQNYVIVKEDCLDWLKLFDETETVKFIHIDGSHEYESVFETIQLILPKMVKGGIICGDDYQTANITRTDLHGGVERAVKEALPNHSNINNLWYAIIE